MTRIAVTIPSYKVRAQVLDVIARIPLQVQRIYVVDDKCPQQSGLFVQQHCTDPRVRVIFHEENQGVGGAVRTGYRAALEE
ncbi:MAG TPA: glycosyltransferase, partial [Bellilinea sp.]|nr:glycosyltransferase [Bellilinea sp.]